MKLHSKTPLVFVIALLLNLILVVALEVALLYRIPAPLTPESLERVSARYENCRVYGQINMDSNPRIPFYRVLTNDGQTDIIPLQRHSFFPSRAKLSPKKILENINLSGQDTHQVLFGTNIYTVFISDGNVHAGQTAGGAFLQAALAKYIGLGAVLAFAELLLLEKLRGN